VVSSAIVPVVTSLTFDSFQGCEGIVSSLYAGMVLSSLCVQSWLRLNSRWWVMGRI